jgi:hypothetical protein
MNPWAEKFALNTLVKGEKAVYSPVLLSQADKRLLDRAAKVAGLSSAVMASRIVSLVLRQNRHRYEMPL